MLPKRFIESSCLKCHHQVTDIPQAKKLQAGYQRIVKYGCTGCHTIGGEGSIGPDLTDERAGRAQPVAHRRRRYSKEWVLKWITNPHAFRPDTRMPRFYGLTNNAAEEDWPKNYAEIHAITHYLFTKSTPPAELRRPARQDRPGQGEGAVPPEGLPGLPSAPALRRRATSSRPIDEPIRPTPSYKLDAAATLRPQELPGVGPQQRHGRFRPEPVEHRGQVPVARPRATNGWRTGSRPPRRTIPRA